MEVVVNIFEQYGGYEVVKQTISNYKQSGDMVTAAGLELRCLEYRREQNIFEVGDWIIVDSYKPEYQFYQITKDDVGSHWINLVDFRHATDAEIEARRRL